MRKMERVDAVTESAARRRSTAVAGPPEFLDADTKVPIKPVIQASAPTQKHPTYFQAGCRPPRAGAIFQAGGEEGGAENGHQAV